MIHIIGLVGNPQVGKSEIAKHLYYYYGFERLRFGGVIKDMLRCLGLATDFVDGPCKNIPSDILCGKSARYAMQTLGTEWGRNLIGSNIWVNVLDNKMHTMIENLGYMKFVIDDVRFMNEMDWLGKIALRHGFKVKLIKVNRKGVENHNDNHVSNTALNEFNNFDDHIHNDGSIEDLYAIINQFIKDWGTK